MTAPRSRCSRARSRTTRSSAAGSRSRASPSTGIGVMPAWQARSRPMPAERHGGARPHQMAGRLHRGDRRRHRRRPLPSAARRVLRPRADRRRNEAGAPKCTRRRRNMPPRPAITLAVEPLNRFECYFLNTDRPGRRAGEAVDEPNYGYLFDTFHINIEENDVLGADPLDVSDRSATCTSPRTIAACRAPGTSPSSRSSTRCVQSGWDGWMTVEAFGSALPDLAAATKIWRPLFQRRADVYNGGYQTDARRLGRRPSSSARPAVPTCRMKCRNWRRCGRPTTPAALSWAHGRWVPACHTWDRQRAAG